MKISAITELVRKYRKSTWVVITSGIIASTFAIVQISADIQSIASGSGDDLVVVKPTGASSISEIIRQTGAGSIDSSCTYQGMRFKNKAGGLVPMQEAEWLATQPEGSVAFEFRCLQASLSSDFSVEVLTASGKAVIKVEGVVSEGSATNLALGLNLQGDGNLDCDGAVFDLPIVQDSSFKRFSGSKTVRYDSSKDCRFVVPYQYAPGTQVNMTKERSLQLSKKIDELLVSNTPVGCTFIAGVIPWSLPDSEDVKQADWINSVSINVEEFAEWSPSADQYRFDPYLGFKLEFRPDWTWVCKQGSLEYSELHFGGYWYDDGGAVNPGDYGLRMDFNPWLEQQVNAKATVELFDAELKSCGVVDIDIVTSTDVDTWFRASDLIELEGAGINTDKCRIISLREFDVN